MALGLKRKPVANTDAEERALRDRLSRVTSELAGLNRDLASQMVLLASQTGDTAPLVGAVQALRRVRDHYSQLEAPTESMEVHEALADTLFTLGRASDDTRALEHSVLSYRSAITLASLLGDEAARTRLRAAYTTAQNALASRGQSVSARRVA